jgi:outer membrane biosynthesis protein TonB
MNDLKAYFEDERRFAGALTLALHLIFLIIALLVTFESERGLRPSFIEVTLGEFRSGSPARPTPARQEPVPPQPPVRETPPVTPPPVEQKPREEAKPVELSKQKPVESEVAVTTPPVTKVDPTVVPVEEPVKQPEPVPAVTVAPTPKPAEPAPQAEAAKPTESTASEASKPSTETRQEAEEGPGEDTELSSPYSLKWEGNLGRDPQAQPLPVNTTNESAVITLRFEVMPDGSIGRVLPLRKMNPDLEREVIRSLRGWRFNRLPTGVPQDSQWGVITFRFVVE